MEDFLCPVCNRSLDVQDGNQLHPNDPNYGVTVYCPWRDCSAQEVSGHGTKMESAFRVIVEKFSHLTK